MGVCSIKNSCKETGFLLFKFLQYVVSPPGGAKDKPTAGLFFRTALFALSWEFLSPFPSEQLLLIILSEKNTLTLIP